MAFSQSLTVAVLRSTPMHFMTSGTVSGISVSMSTLPLYLGSKRSQIELMFGARSVRTMRPVMPLCHGTEKLRFGSNVGCWRDGIRFRSTFGIPDLSTFCR